MENRSSRRESPDIVRRTFEFAVRIVKLCRVLNQKPGVPKNLIWQLADAGTSVGANVEEGQAAQSKPDFIHKYSIAQKEARESSFFLRLFLASELLTAEEEDGLVDEANQITAILASSVVTAKRNLENERGSNR